MSNNPIAPFSVRLLLLAALTVLVFPVGCSDGCGKETESFETPETIDGRIEAHLQRLPASTTGVGVIGAIREFRQAATVFKDRIDKSLPVSGLVEQPFKMQLGINPFAGKSWQEAGLGEDSDLVVALVEGHPVVLSFIENRQRFERHLGQQLERHWDIGGAAKRQQVAGHSVKVASKEGGPKVIWTYRGEQVVAVFPPIESLRDADAATMSNVVGGLLDRTAEDSLATTDAYKAFRADTTDSNSFVFFPGDGLRTLLPAGADLLRGVAGDAQSATPVGTGFVATMRESGVRTRTWVGLPEGAIEPLEKSLRPSEDLDWHRLATDKTLAGLRLSLDPKQAWDTLLTVMPDDRAAATERRVKRLADKTGIDLKTQFVDAWTGNAAAFFYGVGPNFSQTGLFENPIGELPQIGAIAGVQFRSKAALAKLAEAIDEKTGDRTTLRPLRITEEKTTDRIRVLVLSGASEESLPIKFYIGDRFLAVSTTAIGESSMFEYLTGTRESSTPLADVDGLDLGAHFATGEAVNALYVNFRRADQAFAARLPPVPMLGRLLKGLDELIVEPTLGRRGLFIDSTIDWNAGD